MHLGMCKWVSVCVCMMGKCVWGGGVGMFGEEEWGRCSVCRVCGCQDGYFWKVMQMLTFMNLRSGTRYTGHS